MWYKWQILDTHLQDYVCFSYTSADTKSDILKLLSTRPQYLNFQDFLIDQNIYTCTLHSVITFQLGLATLGGQPITHTYWISFQTLLHSSHRPHIQSSPNTKTRNGTKYTWERNFYEYWSGLIGRESASALLRVGRVRLKPIVGRSKRENPNCISYCQTLEL